MFRDCSIPFKRRKRKNEELDQLYKDHLGWDLSDSIPDLIRMIEAYLEVKDKPEFQINTVRCKTYVKSNLKD